MAATTANVGVLNADALPEIDLRLFSQSDLRALAKSSSSAYDFSSRFGLDGEVPVPKIDRAVFNESAGSRKQTYSRLRLAPRTEVSRSGRERVVGKVDEADEWENRRIVSMLKELVGEESGEGEVFEGLVAVEIECDPELNVEDAEVVRQEVRVEIGSVSPVRRKRGRPRKDDSSFYANKIVLHNDSEYEFSGEKKICKEMKGKGIKRDIDDMEMMNINEVMVDVVALGNVDDPFGPEIRRMTEGLGTKEQLLEFLNGLEGQWVSRRRKRKIVDADAFGDFLPRGWKLVFSIKKKAGHAWLICRQYISPSGREFISCKEVSSYLQHLSGMQSEEHKVYLGDDKTNMSANEIPNENMGIQISGIGNDNTIMSADKIQNENMGIQITAIGNESNDKIIMSAGEIPNENRGIQINVIGNDKSIMPAEKIPNVDNQVIQDDIISQFPNLANQVQPGSGIPSSEMVKNDDLLHILPSSPKSKPKRRKSGTLVSDGVITTDGKFECQFCHKIFEERRRYNGHVGVHVRSVEARRGSGTNPAGTDLSSASGVHPVASGLDVTTTSISGAQANNNDIRVSDVLDFDVLHTNFLVGSNIRELTDSSSNIEMPTLNAVVSQNVSDKAVVGNFNPKSEKDSKMADDGTVKVGSSINFGADMNQYVEPQIDFVKNGLHELREGSRISKSDVKTVGEDKIYEKSSVVYNAGTLSNGDGKSIGAASIEEKLIAGRTVSSEINDGGLVSDGNVEHTIDFTEHFGNEKSPFRLGMIDNQQEDVCAFYQQRSSGDSPVASFLNEQRHMSTISENEAVVSGLMEFKEKHSGENPSNLVSNKQTLTVNNNFSDGISGNSSAPVFLHPSDSRIQPAVISTSNQGALGVNDWSRDTPQKIFGFTYLFESLNQNLGATNVESTSTDGISKSPWKSPTLNPQLALDNVDRTPNAMAGKEFWKAVSVPSNSIANNSNEISLDMAAVSSLEDGNGSGGFPFSSNGGEQGFNIRNSMVGMGNSAILESRPERDYVSDFVNQFENGQNNQGSSNIFPSRPVEQSRDNVGFTLNSELKISLGNNQPRLENVNRDLKGHSLGLSGNNEHFGLQNHDNSFYNSSVQEARNQRASESSLIDQFGQQQLFALHNNLNQAYNGSMWGGQRLGVVGNFGSNDVMTGFATGQPQRSENVLTGGNWSIGMNAHDISGSSLPRDQPSGYLHSLQMMSNKGDDQLFNAAQKFNNIEGFQDQRSGIQQREYNFLNTQAKPYAQEPNVMHYPQQMQQSYDPGSWLGRQTPFPQVPARSPPTVSCVWCSTMFYHESLNTFSQADTIVPTCPSCKAKMSEQLNLF